MPHVQASSGHAACFQAQLHFKDAISCLPDAPCMQLACPGKETLRLTHCIPKISITCSYEHVLVMQSRARCRRSFRMIHNRLEPSTKAGSDKLLPIVPVRYSMDKAFRAPLPTFRMYSTGACTHCADAHCLAGLIT